MKNLRYVGGDDVRELTPTDLEKLGVEDAEATLTFRKGTSTTLDDSVAETLLEKIPNLREATEDELKQEERDLEAALGFAPYNPSDHTVAEVNEVLANASEERRNYILDQEHAGQNRKTIYQAVGREWTPKEESEAEMAQHPEAADADVEDLTEQADATAEAGGTPQTTEGSGGTGGGTVSSSGPANTSSDAT